MESFKNVNVGLIGCGTVGSGVVKLIKKGVSKKYGVNINLLRIAEINRKVKISQDIEFTTKAEEVINDPEVEIVVELIGGYEPALTYIMQALDNNKNVVTANKAVLSEYAPLIFNKAKKKNLCIGFEASVCGSIPIISILLGSLPNDIKSIIGIVNGLSLIHI